MKMMNPSFFVDSCMLNISNIIAFSSLDGLLLCEWLPFNNISYSNSIDVVLLNSDTISINV
jgi:hypothetical protein